MNKEKLMAYLKELEERVSKLEQGNQPKSFVPNNFVDNSDKPKLNRKNSEALRVMLNCGKLDDWQTKFVHNVLSNNYPTITEKQTTILTQIKDKIGLQMQITEQI